MCMHKSALVQRLFHPGDRFYQVLEYAFFASLDINGGDHARQDAQFFAVFVGQFAACGLNQHAVVGLVGVKVEFAATAFVAQGIRADEGYFAM